MLKDFNELIQGDTQTFNLKLTDKSTGDAIDITGWKIFMTIKRNIEMTDAEATGVNGTKKDVTPTSPTTGQCSIVFSNDDTNELTGKYYYDITYVTDTGDRGTILIGNLTFEKTRTKRVS